MKIKSALLLSAGFGTRMGEVGKELPKPLWPVFEKPIIQLEVDFLRSLGFTQIFINIHHNANQIKDYFNKNPQKEIVIIEEPEILGIGGAVYNIKEKLKSDDVLFVTTSDQFCFYKDKSSLKKALELLKQSDVVLFGIFDREIAEHNEVMTNGNKVIGIQKGTQENLPYITHSGASLIKVSSIENLSGYQDYFDTLADYKNKEVLILKENEFEYWDYGTKSRYFSNMWKNLKNIQSDNLGAMENFLISSNAFELNKSKKDKNSYGPTSDSNLINLADCEIENQNMNKCIVIECEDKVPNLDKIGIYWNDIYTSSDT